MQNSIGQEISSTRAAGDHRHYRLRDDAWEWAAGDRLHYKLRDDAWEGFAILALEDSSHARIQAGPGGPFSLTLQALNRLRDCGTLRRSCACGRPRWERADVDRWVVEDAAWRAQIGTAAPDVPMPDPPWARPLCWTLPGLACRMRPIPSSDSIDGLSREDCHARWRLNAAALESGDALPHALTPAQIAQAKRDDAIRQLRHADVLRHMIAWSAEREQNRIRVDLEFEPWE